MFCWQGGRAVRLNCDRNQLTLFDLKSVTFITHRAQTNAEAATTYGDRGECAKSVLLFSIIGGVRGRREEKNPQLTPSSIIRSVFSHDIESDFLGSSLPCEFPYVLFYVFCKKTIGDSFLHIPSLLRTHINFGHSFLGYASSAKFSGGKCSKQLSKYFVN